MAADLNELSGDVAGLIGYRRHAAGMSYAPPRIGRAYLAITCEVRGYSGDQIIALADEPGELHPLPEIRYVCGTCGSTDPETIEGLPYCPNDFHYQAPESNWRRIAGYIAGIAIIGAWLLALFLYIAGVIQ